MKLVYELKSLLIAFFCMSYLLAGCSERHSSKDVKSTEVLETLRNQSGINLTQDFALVNYGDGGGRDSGFSFFEWALYSPSKIQMKKITDFEVSNYVKLPVGDSVEFAESIMRGKQQINKPESAYAFGWQTNGFQFRCTVIVSGEGDFLVVERFTLR